METEMGPISLVENCCSVLVRLERMEDVKSFDRTMYAKDISSVRCFREGVVSITNLSVILDWTIYTHPHVLHCSHRRAVGVGRLSRHKNVQTYEQLRVLARIPTSSCCTKVYRNTNFHAKTIWKDLL
jgi:hypothetical protein